MPGHHGQTYDPQEEPAPRGGWFAFVDRPFPERLDRAFRALAIIAALAADAGFVFYMGGLTGTGLTGGAVLTATAVGLIPAAMAYGFTRGIGLILVAVYGTVRDGSEFVIDWRAVRHDVSLRRTWIVILEGALLLAAAGVSLWGLYLFARHGLVFGLAVCAVVQIMTYWPLIRRRIAASRTRG